MQILARERERRLLAEIRASGRPEFVAVYGRRRVGKTYLIENVFNAEPVFLHITGTPKQKRPEQLWDFAQVYADTFNNGDPIVPPRNWQQAFRLLQQAIGRVNHAERIVLFLDEVPWLATRRSGFLEALAYLWNRYLSSDPRIILIVCGSAATWIIKNVVDSRGGLYNRLTRRIHLSPLNLHDTEVYLRGRGVRLDRRQLVEVYMALGGIPAYLNNVKPGRSSAQIITDVHFSPDSPIAGEFDRIFRAMFSNSENHTRVMRVLLTRRHGLSSSELFRSAAIRSGSTQNRVKRELAESDFISETRFFPFKKRNTLIRLVDEYTIFFLTWRDQIPGGRRAKDPLYWRTLQTSPRWSSWSGYAFEAICHDHVTQIATALGIQGIHYECYAWSAAQSEEHAQGAQVDLVIDRADRCVNLCEIKFCSSPFVLTREYAQRLREKRDLFIQVTGTRKTVFTTLITAFGAKENEYYLGAVDNQLSIDDLFLPDPKY